MTLLYVALVVLWFVVALLWAYYRTLNQQVSDLLDEITKLKATTFTFTMRVNDDEPMRVGSYSAKDNDAYISGIYGG